MNDVHVFEFKRAVEYWVEQCKDEQWNVLFRRAYQLVLLVSHF